MVIIDTRRGTLISSINVGRYPFGITLSPHGKRAYVANVGMYEYKKIKGVDKDNPNRAGLKFHPY